MTDDRRDGYVQVLFDVRKATGQMMIGDPSPSQWRVIHDANGRIVIRDHQGVVLATARWVGDQAIDRAVRSADVPSHDMWAALEYAIRAGLAESRHTGRDERTDNGTVANPIRVERRPDPLPPAEEPAKPAEKVGILGWIGATVVVAVLGFVLFVVMFWVIPWLKRHDLMPQGTTANGAACRTDSDCKSGDCYKKTCRGEAVKVRGDRCDRDADCKSGSCQFSSNTCN